MFKKCSTYVIIDILILHFSNKLVSILNFYA